MRGPQYLIKLEDPGAASAPAKRLSNGTLFPDDTISVIAQKIQRFMPSLQQRLVYLWASIPVKPASKSRYAQGIAIGLMRGRKYVSADEAQTVFTRISGGVKAQFPPGTDVLNIADVIKAFASASKWQTLHKPLSVQHFAQNQTMHPMHLPVNPLQVSKDEVKELTSFVQGGNAVIHFNWRALLETVLADNDSSSVTIHVCTMDDVLRRFTNTLRIPETTATQALSAYFAEPPKAPASPDIDRVIASVLYDESLDDSVSSDSYILSYRTVIAPLAETGTSMDVREITAALALDADVPYAYTHAPTGQKMHSLVKRSFSLEGGLGKTHAVQELMRWMETSKRMTSDSANVLCVWCAPQQLTPFVIVVDGTVCTCELRFRFDASNNVHKEGLQKYTPHVIRGLEALQKTGKLFKDEDLSTFTLLDESASQLRMGAWLTPKRQTPSLEKLALTVKKLMSPFFVVIPARRGETTLTLLYKRYSDYSQDDIVQAVLDGFERQHKTTGDMPTQTWAQTLSEMFDMQLDDASAHVENWSAVSRMKLGGENSSTLVRYRKNGVFVAVSRNSETGITYSADGLGSWDQSVRLERAVKYLVMLSATQADGIKVSQPPKRPQWDEPEAEAADAQLLAELMAEVKKNAAANSTPDLSRTQQESAGSDRRYAMRMLQKADPKLFGYGKYAAVCTATAKRQPIAVSKEELEKIGKLYPGAVTNFVNTGSTPELASKNHYICPYVWCPKSRVALSKKQFEKLGRRCPVVTVEETPIVMDSPYFKGHARHAELLDPSKHPDGFAAPCCFKHNNGESIDDNTNSGPNYVQSERFPAPPDRWAILPPVLNALFHGGKCGNRADGSGNLSSGSGMCLARRGVETTNQPFLQCVSSLWGIDVDAVTDRLVQRLDMPLFLSLNNGDLCKEFVGLTQPAFREFSQWFLQQRTYIAKFNLQRVAERVARSKGMDDEDVHREYIWYAAFTAYRAFLRDETALKMPSNAMHLVGAVSLPLLVFELEEDDSVHVPCLSVPLITAARVHVILTRHGVFEPVWMLDKYGNKSSVLNVHGNLVKLSTSYCGDQRSVQQTYLRLRAEASEVHQVIDANLKVVALMSRSKLVRVNNSTQGIVPNVTGSIRYAKDVNSFTDKEKTAYRAGQHAATGWRIEDRRAKKTAEQRETEVAVDEAVREVEASIDRSQALRQVVYYLNHPMNPMTIFDKMDVLLHHVGKSVPKAAVYPRVLERVLLQNSTRTVIPDRPDAVLLSDRDVAGRNARELFKLIKTPFNAFDIDMDKVFQTVALKTLGVKAHAEETARKMLQSVSVRLVQSDYVYLRWFALERGASSLLTLAQYVANTAFPDLRLPSVTSANLALASNVLESVCETVGVGVAYLIAGAPAVDSDKELRVKLYARGGGWLILWQNGKSNTHGIITDSQNHIVWLSLDKVEYMLRHPQDKKMKKAAAKFTLQK